MKSASSLGPQAVKSGETKRLWRVERFRPRYCPKCCRRFERESSTGEKIPGEWLISRNRPTGPDGKLAKAVDSTAIICAHCGNITAVFDRESYCFRNKKEAQAKLKAGFFNLQSIIAVGNMAVDHYTKIDGQVEYL